MMIFGILVTADPSAISVDAAGQDEFAPGAPSLICCVDSVTAADDSIVVRGWIFHQGNIYGFCTVTVFIGGDKDDPDAEQHFAYADKYRPDVNNVYGCGENHGFDERIHTDRIGVQPVYIYAAEDSGVPTNTLLCKTNVTLYGAAEQPSFNEGTIIQNTSTASSSKSNILYCVESVDGSKGRITVKGWGFDNDDAAQNIMVHVYIGAPAGHQDAELHIIKADKYRKDVNYVHNCGDYHGFEETIYTKKTGNQNVYVYAINIGSGNYNPRLESFKVKIDDGSYKTVESDNIVAINNTSRGYRLLLDLSEYTDAHDVLVRTWTNNRGANNYIVTRAEIYGNTAYADIYASSLNYDTSGYINSFYVYNSKGQQTYYKDKDGQSYIQEVSIGYNSDDSHWIAGVKTFNGHTYTLVVKHLTWEQAKQWCENNGGYLATITSEEEWDAVKCLIAELHGPVCWLGDMCYRGVYSWVTGESVTYEDWYRAPENSTSTQLGFCTYMGSLLNCYEWGSFFDPTDFVGCFIMEQQCTFAVNYDFNGGSGSYDNELVHRGEKLVLPVTDTEKAHSEFIGWSTDKDAMMPEYLGGERVPVTSDVTYYAVWREKHTYTDTVIEPTCTEKGYTLHTCNECGESYKDSYTDMKEHDYSVTVVPATAHEDGYTLHTCVNCGQYFKDNYVSYNVQNTSSISAENIKLGTSFKVSASAKGGDGNYTYTIRYKKSSSNYWTTKQNKSANAVLVIKPSASVLYDVSVTAYDGRGNSDEKIFRVNVFAALENKSSLSSESISFGESVEINAMASGGLGDITYAVYCKKASSDKWSAVQKYSDNKTVSFTPAAAVDYDVMVKVRDSRGIVVNKTFRLSVIKLTNTSEIASEQIKFGSSIEISCSAVGGKGPYQYSVLYKKVSSEKWTVKQAFSDNNLVSITPASKTTYDICVKVGDSRGVISKKTFTVKVVK